MSQPDDDLDRMALSTAPVAGPAEPAPAGLPGRYVVLDMLGAGGMGVVHIAYDRELDRKVALKLVAGTREGAGRVRLLREAQALAKLKHPNVVTVYDVGTLEDRLFVAMELVEGTSLRAWLAEHTPSWREAAKLFLAAGRGLEAAHAAGLVHRDFKPDNVLIGRDGSVRVADFGLARFVGEAHAGGPAPASPALEQGVTEAGTVLGTPRYMAPEQREGSADPRSDQFSFCVALYETLYGNHPFADRPEAEAPSRSRVPRRLRDAVLRGLAQDPARRFPTMAPLLAELARDPAARRRRIAGVAAAVAVLATAVAVPLLWARQQRLVCAGAERKLAGVWDGERKRAVRAAFGATGLAYAAPAADLVDRQLDDYARAFVAAHTEACEATQVRREQSAEVEDARMACLDERLGQLRAITDLMAAADAPTVTHVGGLLDSLASPNDCMDPASLPATMRLPADPATRARIAAINQNIDTANALVLLGAFDRASAVAVAAANDARAVAHPWAIVRANLTLALIADGRGQIGAAIDQLHHVVVDAEALGADRLAVRAASMMGRDLGYDMRRPDEGRRWARLALALAERVHSDDGRASAENSLGYIDLAQARYEDADEHYRRALAVLEKRLGPDASQVNAVVFALGSLATKRGRYEEAEAWQRRALASYERTMGPDNANVGKVLNNYAITLWRLGRYDDARAAALRAVQIVRRTAPTDHAGQCTYLLNLADAHMALDRLDEALAGYGDALAENARAAPPSDRLAGAAHSGIGDVLRKLGRTAEARREYEEALPLQEKALGPHHPELHDTLKGMARLEVLAGRSDAARKLLERAIGNEQAAHDVGARLVDLYTFVSEVELADHHVDAAVAAGRQAVELGGRAGLGAHPNLVAADVALARAELAQRRPGDALAPLESAMAALATRPAANADERLSAGRAHFALAEALAALGRDPERALALARSARDELRAAGNADELGEVEAWLRRR